MTAVVIIMIGVSPYLGFNLYHSLILKHARLCVLSGALIALIMLVLSCLLVFVMKERLWLWFFGLGVSLPILGGIGAAILLFSEAPALRDLDIVHAPHLAVETIEAFSFAGSVPLCQTSGAVMVTEDAFYIQTPDNILAIGDLGWLHHVTSLKTKGDRKFVSSKPIKELYDFLALPGMVLVIAGDKLLRTDQSGKLADMAVLPGPGFQFAQRIAQHGLSSRILVFGNVDDRGLVFDLKPDGDYTKVADVKGHVTAAAGAFGSTALAVDNRVLLLTPRFEPSIVFVAPQGVGPITSILGRIQPEAQPDDVLWLFATSDGVFAQQNGVAYLAVAGMGGQLRAHDTDTLCAYLYDGPRRAAVTLSF